MKARITAFECTDRCGFDCRAEARAFKAAARRKNAKPAGYTWRLYNDPKAGTPRPVQTGSLHVPAWAHEDPRTAYKRILAAEDTDASARERASLYEEWLATRDAA